MRSEDHQLQLGQFISRWQPVDAVYPVGAEGTGHTFAPLQYIAAPVLSQPSMPLPIGKARGADLNLSPDDAAAIAEAYRVEGRLAATVDPKIIRRSDNRVDLVFEINEGKPVEVERLSFVGNRAYSDRRLRQVLETKQAGILRQIIGRDAFVVPAAGGERTRRRAIGNDVHKVRAVAELAEEVAQLLFTRLRADVARQPHHVHQRAVGR